jgi:hypothetical protein
MDEGKEQSVCVHGGPVRDAYWYTMATTKLWNLTLDCV